MSHAGTSPRTQDGATHGVGSGDLLGGLTPDSVAYGLKVGDRWGAYWLHADGMMRLYPPMNKRTSMDVMTDHEKCRHIFAAVCGDKQCELTYAELESLQDCGFITNLKREKGRRWSFEWTDKLHEYAIASPGNQKRIISDALSA